MRIVVGYDGSDAAKRALQRAADYAKEDDRIVVVASAEPHARSGPTGGAHLDPSEFQQRRGDLDEAKQFVSERGLDAELIEAVGDPAIASKMTATGQVVRPGKAADFAAEIKEQRDVVKTAAEAIGAKAK